MSSEVYFSNLRSRGQKDNKNSKIKQLFDGAKFGDLIQEEDLTAIKLHFGERGNDAFLKPVLVNAVVEKNFKFKWKTIFN
nr:hypothetical protein [Methanobacterium formicicum]